MPKFSLPVLIATAILLGCAHPPAPAAISTPEASTRFLTAVTTGDIATVERELARDPTLAMARTKSGHSAVLAALFRPAAHGADADFYPAQSNQVLHAIVLAHPALDPFETAAVGDPAALGALVATDPALVTQLGPFGLTLLHFAAFGGNAPAVALLVDRGAVVDQISANQFANTPLHVALLTGQYAAARVLIERGANVEADYEAGTRPIHQAAQLGRVDLLTLLLDHGAAIDARTEAGATALSIAIEANHPEAAALLRARGGHAEPHNGQ